MSVLTNKNILVVGKENTKISSLEESLITHGAAITHSLCSDISDQFLKENHVDFIIINYLVQDDVCQQALQAISGPLVERVIPVFALIEDTPDCVKDVLSLGIADYLTLHDDESLVLSKIKAVFGQSDVFAGSGSIDITSTEASVSATGIRVFVVEDDPLLRNLLSLKMDKTQFPYEFSVDGINVLPAMRQFKPDIVILDLMLPGRSGFEVLTDIRSDDMLKDTPVIVFSNRDGQEDRDKAKQLGVKGFYVKAMTDLSELIETIESIVKK